MFSKIFSFILLVIPLDAFGQEHLFLQTDKKICAIGDTIWLRAYQVNDSVSTASANFYIEIYNEQHTRIYHEVFPLSNHIGIGQIPVPAIPGNYWLRGYTRNAASEAIIPINVIDSNQPAIIWSYSRAIKDTAALDSLISIEKVGQDYIIRIADQISCNYSLAVTDTTDPGTALMLSFPTAGSSYQKWDTAGLVFRARLSDNKKRRKKEPPEMIMYFQQDSLTTPIQLLTIDSLGIVRFPNMFFYNTGFIHYQINEKQRTSQKSVVLTLLADSFPPFTPPPLSVYRIDTILVRAELKEKQDTSLYFSGKTKNLKLIEVKGRWMDRHLALNKQYVISKEFAPIEHYTFDLRNPDNPGGIYSVLEYLYRELPSAWAMNTVQSCREGIQFYVDEQLVNPNILQTRALSEFAYAKVYQDLHPPCPAICLYTRKGKDLEKLNSSLGVLELKGYEKPLCWTTPDRITWLWEPYLTTNVYRIHVPTKCFKVVLLGTTAEGEALKFEKIVTDGQL